MSRDLLPSLNKYKAFSNNPTGKIDKTGLIDTNYDFSKAFMDLQDDDYDKRTSAFSWILENLDDSTSEFETELDTFERIANIDLDVYVYFGKYKRNREAIKKLNELGLTNTVGLLCTDPSNGVATEEYSATVKSLVAATFDRYEIRSIDMGQLQKMIDNVYSEMENRECCNITIEVSFSLSV